MATGYIDKYVFALMLDSSNFQKGANLAERTIGGLKTTLLRAYSAIGGIDIFKNMISTYTDAAKSVDRMSLVTNEDINSLQAWQKAISDTGGNVNAFNGTIRALSDDMAQLKNYGTSKYLGTMQWLGIDFTNEKGKIKSATELLLAYQKAIAGMDNQTAWNFAQKLGVDEDTFALMRRHPDDLEKIIQKYTKLAVITKWDIEINRQWENVLSDFRYSWLQFSKEIGSNVLPIIQNDLSPVIKDVMEYLKENKGEIKNFFTLVDEELKNILPAVKGLGYALKFVLEIMGKYGKAVEEVATENEDFIDKHTSGPTNTVLKGLNRLTLASPGLTTAQMVLNSHWLKKGINSAGEFLSDNLQNMNTVNISQVLVQTNNPVDFKNGLLRSASATNVREVETQTGGAVSL